MPRAHAGVLPGATLILVLAVGGVSAEERPIAKAVSMYAGFFTGGYLGAAIDGDCGGCDDPGLKGALIGAPIGAVTGGILGGKFLF